MFFDTSLNMDDDECFQPVLTQEEIEFKTLDTVPVVSVPLIFGVSIHFVGTIDCTSLIHRIVFSNVAGVLRNYRNYICVRMA